MISDPNKKSGRFTDIQTDKRIHEILTDERDTVSEKDISNVKTDIALEVPLTPEEVEGKIRDDEDPEINSVWNIEEGEN